LEAVVAVVLLLAAASAIDGVFRFLHSDLKDLAAVTSNVAGWWDVEWSGDWVLTTVDISVLTIAIEEDHEVVQGVSLLFERAQHRAEVKIFIGLEASFDSPDVFNLVLADKVQNNIDC